MYVCTYVCVCMYVYRYVCVCVCVYVCMYVCSSRSSSLFLFLTASFNDAANISQHQWQMNWRVSNDKVTGTPTRSEQSLPHCPSVDNKTTTWTNLGRNTGLRSERPTTHRLSNGTGPLFLASYADCQTVSSTVRYALKKSQPSESSSPSSYNSTTTSIILSTKFVKFYAIYENYGSNNGNERSRPREEQSEVWRSKQPCSN